MNWLLYLPSGLAIYLLLISGLSSRYIKNKIQDFVSKHPKLKDHEEVIQNITLDWAARLSFFNSMFAAMVSVFSIWSKTQSYGLAVGTFIILLLIFIAMMWWVMDHRVDQLPATMLPKLQISHAAFCRLILILVNLILIGAITWSQYLVTNSSS